MTHPLCTPPDPSPEFASNARVKAALAQRECRSTSGSAERNRGTPAPSPGVVRTRGRAGARDPGRRSASAASERQSVALLSGRQCNARGVRTPCQPSPERAVS